MDFQDFVTLNFLLSHEFRQQSWLKVFTMSIIIIIIIAKTQ